MAPAPNRECWHDPTWQYMYELEDTTGSDDLPAQPGIAAGFSTTRAYFLGNDFIRQKRFGRVQFCSGRQSPTPFPGSCQLACVDLTDVEIGHGVQTAASTYAPDLSDATKFKQMVACFTGQCPGNAYASGFFWECQNTWCDLRKDPYNWANDWSGSQSSWNVPGSTSSYTSGIGPHGCAGSNCPFHVWGSGLVREQDIMSNARPLSPAVSQHAYPLHSTVWRDFGSQTCRPCATRAT